MIYVVGYTGKQDADDWVLDAAAMYLVDLGREALAEDLLDRRIEIFDMHTRPEMGDVMDAALTGVDLVVALHLFGIGKIPGNPLDKEHGGYFHNRENGHLLDRCMACGIPLFAWGDQPWYSSVPFTKSEVKDLTLVLYEPVAKDAA